TVKNGKGCKYGFKEGHPVPGYFPSPEKGRDFDVADPEAELAEALQLFGLTLNDLPEAAKATWSKRKSFTLVLGVGARNVQRQTIPAATWLDHLVGHQQMVIPLQRSDIFAFHNGKPLEDGRQLELPQIDPILGAESPRIVQIPATLVDPVSGDAIE